MKEQGVKGAGPQHLTGLFRLAKQKVDVGLGSLATPYIYPSPTLEAVSILLKWEVVGRAGRAEGGEGSRGKLLSVPEPISMALLCPDRLP